MYFVLLSVLRFLQMSIVSDVKDAGNLVEDPFFHDVCIF